MDITSPCVVTLTWTLSDAQGQLIDELQEPVEFLFGGEDDALHEATLPVL